LRSPRLVFALSGAAAVPGGISSVNLSILEVLPRVAEQRGLELSVLSLLESDSDRPASLPPSTRFRGFRGSKSRFSTALLTSVSPGSFWFFDQVGLAGPLLPFAVMKLAPTIVFSHNHDLWGRVRRKDAWSIRAAALCVTNSEFTLRKMRDRYGQFNGVACPLGLSSQMPLNQHAPPPCEEPLELCAASGTVRRIGQRVLLLVARMDRRERQKGHFRLLRVLPDVLARFPDAQAIFAGDGNDRDAIAAAARDAGVGDAVFLPGHVSADTLKGLYRRCLAFVMPSTQEGFGLAYLEAMNFARPCIGCHDQGAEDVIVHADTGFLLREPDNPRELYEAVCTLLADDSTAARLGRNGFERLHARFTARHFQSRIEQLLLTAIESGQGFRSVP
jgi:phosphatidyl-myo-inositol dimannoside synthase